MIFDRVDLSLPVFRGSKGADLDEVIVAAASEAVAHTYTTCLLSCGVWSAYGSPIACASWIERLNVREARGFTSTSLLHLHKSQFVLFFVLFLGQVIFP